MTVLSKFLKWLKGDQPPPSPSEIRTSLRILERRLIRYENELKIKYRRSVKRAKEHIRKGELELAREYAKQALVYEKNIKNSMRIRAQLESIKGLLERGLVMQQLAVNIRKMLPILAGISRSIGDRELYKSLVEISKISERMNMSEELLMEGMELTSESSEDVTASVDDFMKKLAEEEGVSLPSPEKKEKISEKEVEDFIKRILQDEE